MTNQKLILSSSSRHILGKPCLLGTVEIVDERGILRYRWKLYKFMTLIKIIHTVKKNPAFTESQVKYDKSIKLYGEMGNN